MTVTYEKHPTDGPLLRIVVKNVSRDSIELLRSHLPWATDMFAMPITITRATPPFSKLERGYTVSHRVGTQILTPTQEVDGTLPLRFFKDFDRMLVESPLIVEWQWHPRFTNGLKAKPLAGSLTIPSNE